MQEDINNIKSTIDQQFAELNSKVDKIGNSLNSKDQLSERILKQLQAFQEYMRALLEPLKKIQNWFD
jgi:aspartate ammonia-lyase